MSKNIEVLLRAKEATELFRPRNILQETPVEALRPTPQFHPIDGKEKEEVELVQRIFLLPVYDAPRLVVFYRVGHTGGGSGICARAGQILANQTGSSVCVVEGDLHSPSLHEYFGVDNLRGLTDAVLEPAPVRDFVHSISGSNLSVLTGGSRCGDAEALWKSERIRSRMAELRKEYFYVLVDGPQVNQHVDAMLLGQIADGAILILESMVTRRETARAVKENLAAANVKILGAVLNNHSFSIPEILYRKL
jgi:polysaccharide biosynthesis transport protein